MKNENLLQFSSFSTAIIYLSKDTKPHKVERTKFLYFFTMKKKYWRRQPPKSQLTKRIFEKEKTKKYSQKTKKYMTENQFLWSKNTTALRV